MKTYIYFNPENTYGEVTPAIFNIAKEVIKISSNMGNYETYYGGVKIQAKEYQIFDNLGALLEYLENNINWKIKEDNKFFSKRLEDIRTEFPEYFI